MVVVLNSNELRVLILKGLRVVVVVVVVTVVRVVGALVGALVVAAVTLQSTLRAKSQESAALLKYRPGNFKIKLKVACKHNV